MEHQNHIKITQIHGTSIQNHIKPSISPSYLGRKVAVAYLPASALSALSAFGVRARTHNTASSIQGISGWQILTPRNRGKSPEPWRP